MSAGESEESMLDDRDQWGDGDEQADSDAEDEAAAVLEWSDRSRWIRHVILWKQEHDEARRRQRGKVDKTARVRTEQLRTDREYNAITAESETSESSISNGDGDGHEESTSHNDDTSTVNDRVEAARAELTAALPAVDAQQQPNEEQQQPHEATAIVVLSSDDIIRPSGSVSVINTSSDTAAASSGPRSARPGRNLPSMIFKHISALKRESADMRGSLSLSTIQGDTQQGQQGPVSSIGGISSERSAVSASEQSEASLALPGRHVRLNSKRDSVELEKDKHSERERDRSGRHRPQRSVTSVHSTSGKWPLAELSVAGYAAPSFAQIASMGRSLLQPSHDEQSGGDELFDIDTHNHTQARGAHSARRGDAPSHTGSASTAAAGGTGSSTRSSLSPAQLKADLLASGLIRDRTHVFTVYPNSVTATELLDWLIANHHADDREHACLVSKTLMLVGLRSFHQQHTDTAQFADDGRFYTFETTAATKGAFGFRMALDRPRHRSVNTKQALAELVQRAAASASANKSATPALAEQVERARVQYGGQSSVEALSSRREWEAGTQLTTLQEVTVDRQQEGSEADAQQLLPAPDVEGSRRNIASSPRSQRSKPLSARPASAGVQFKRSSPPTATRPTFLREQKASSRWPTTPVGHTEAVASITAADSKSMEQRHRSDSALAGLDGSDAGVVHSQPGQFPLASARTVRSPSVHQRSNTSTSTITGYPVRNHRPMTAGGGGGGGTAGVRWEQVTGPSATQDALFALGVADLALVDTQLAEQRERDELHSRSVARPAQLQPALPGELNVGGEHHGSSDKQAAVQAARVAGHARSPTLPSRGLFSMARAASPSHVKSKTMTFFQLNAAPLPRRCRLVAGSEQSERAESRAGDQHEQQRVNVTGRRPCSSRSTLCSLGQWRCGNVPCSCITEVQ